MQVVKIKLEAKIVKGSIKQGESYNNLVNKTKREVNLSDDFNNKLELLLSFPGFLTDIMMIRGGSTIGMRGCAHTPIFFSLYVGGVRTPKNFL